MLRIAIDGPGGAGKSSVAKAIAKELGIIYVDTGALYRSIGLYMLKNSISTKDNERVISALRDISLKMSFENNKQIILLNGVDVGDTIRTPEVSMAASEVSAISEVRAFLLETQRNIAKSNSVIMDGRDIGTVILPDAEVKIFLTASPEARAKRRHLELTEKGIDITYEQVYNEMVTRDTNDSTREIAPCVQAEDAILLDSSELTFEETVRAVLKIVKKIKKKRNKKGSALYKTLKFLVSPFYRLFARVHVVGKENIPKDGGYIICCNHIGINDIIIMGTTFNRQIHFLAKKEWLKVPVLGWFMKKMGAIILDRGGRDVGALKHAVNAVKSGKTIAIFPQGHRYPGVNPQSTPIKSGISLIAYHSGAPIIPVCLKTKDCKYKFLRKIEIIYGRPLSNQELGLVNGGYDEYRRAADIAFSSCCELGGYYKEETGQS
jgi:cytidylate kinase